MNGDKCHDCSSNPSQNQNFWISEALAVTSDISKCVISAALSDNLTSKEPLATCAYINLETLESRKICIKLTTAGFTIVGNDFDDKSSDDPDQSQEEQPIIYESPESLLQSISPSYNSRFASQLYQKLAELAKKS